MDCPSCGRSNRPGARFCSGCGNALALRCPACGARADGDATFCDACGASLAERPRGTSIARKVVTIVFADLIGSVSLHERLDAESVRRVMERYHRAMSAAVEIHGGTVVQLLGDGVLAAFGVPRVAEDDAIRAVRAASGMQRAFRELAREQETLAGVGLRVAVNTGEVVVSDDETSVIGDPTNVAARLQHEAGDGDVLVGEGTQRLVADLVTLTPLGSIALRGRAGAVAAWRLVSLERPARAQSAELVGRDEELGRLLAVYEAAAVARSPRLAVVLGSPGLGKSRLVAELAGRVGEHAAVLAARCDAAGGATFAPIAQALRTYLRVGEGAAGVELRTAIDAVVPDDDAERPRIAAGIAALIAGAPGVPEETFFVVRRLLASLASVRPVVLLIDDLHWAAPLMLDLVEHLIQWSAGVPLLVLAAARPELREVRSTLTLPGGLPADVVVLSALEAGAATRLAASVIGASELPAALVGRVLATSEGNPLFVAELVRMLVQDGTLRREGERWVTTAELAKLEMPPTIQVLLAARIERLRPEERGVLERAAVIGRVFSRAAVAHLLARDEPDLDARLESLRRSELIEPDSGWFLGEPALRFHHVLIRDAAYRRVLKETRAELHERFADWIASRAGEPVERDETIGWHLEQAHRNLREIGALGARGRKLGERATRHLGAAGRRALARDDLSVAAELLGRAMETLDDADPARADLALDWCEALLAAGEVAGAGRALGELDRLAAGSQRLRAWHTCFAGQLASLVDPQSLRATVEAVAAAAASLAEAGDPAGEAKAHTVHAGALARLGEVGACEAALDHALAAARRAHDRRRANAVLAGAPAAALWGPRPLARASGRCLDVVRVLHITQGAPVVEAVALRCQAVLEALRGRGEAARRMVAAARRALEELGIGPQLLETDVFAGLIELLEGEAGAAESLLRVAYEGLRGRGLGIDAARAAALLGRAVLAQDRAVEAEALSHASEALAGDDLKAAIAWRCVRAEALARRGEPGLAVELAREAVALAAATDALLDHADARLALAVALRAAGRGAEADAEEARAIELWGAKGATRLAERARARAGPAESRPEGLPSEADASGSGREWGALADAEAPEPAELPPPGRPRFPNATTRATDRFRRCWETRDWEGVLAMLAPDVELDDRRSLFRLQSTGEEFLANLRFLFAMKGSRFDGDVLATRGELLALARASFNGELGENARIAVEHLSLTEVDARGRYRALVLFDADDVDAAYAELDRRFAAGEGARHGALLVGLAELERGWRALDVAGLRRVVADGFTVQSHRRLVSTARPLDRDGWLAMRRVMIEDLELEDENRLNHLRITPRAVLRAVTWQGTRAGGRFENPIIFVNRHDGVRLLSQDTYDGDQVAEAIRRFDELSREPGAESPPDAPAPGRSATRA